ncbi:MAG: sulfatase [Candidatus Sumerlaeia bacterium]
MSKKQPNILMIVTDQQRANTIAAVGDPMIKTPNLDRLVKRGVAFRRAYTVCPVCAPTRGSISTGVPPHEVGSADNCGHAEVNVPDFASMLKAAGYETRGYGKSYDCFAPGKGEAQWRGFDEWLAWKHYNSWWEKLGFDYLPCARQGGSEYYYIPSMQPYPEKYSRSAWLTQHCVDYLNQRQEGDKPFLLCAHFGEPHPGWNVPYPWSHLYRGNEMPHPIRPANYREYQCRANRFQNRYKWMEDTVKGDDTFLRIIRAAYYGTVSYVDWKVGQILEALGDEIDNTLIIFTTDHGEMLGDYGCVGKRCMMEGAVRVPLLASLPGFLPEGKECRAAASLVDIMPTICEAAGLETPPLSEGISLTKVAEMEAGERIVFSQFSRDWNGQYFAADGNRTYWYSAADKREWTFAVDDELKQGPILPMDERAKELKQALIDRHRDEPFSHAVEGDDWKEHDIPDNPLETDPDYGYLFAEPKAKIQADVDALGPEYARKVIDIGHGHPMAEHMVPLTREEQEEWKERQKS